MVISLVTLKEVYRLLIRRLIRLDLIGALLALIGLDLIGLDLIGVLRIALALIGADLIGLDLIGLDLIGLDLIGADLIGLDLIGLDLIELAFLALRALRRRAASFLFFCACFSAMVFPDFSGKRGGLGIFGPPGSFGLVPVSPG